MSGFKIASRFKAAALLINNTPIDKFPLLLTRIVSKLHIAHARLFSDEEEAQLCSLFALSDADLRLVLDGCCYVFEQAAYTSTGPEPLYALLLEAGFDEPHGKALGRMWAVEAPAFVARLKARTLGGPALVGTDYQLNLVVGGSALTRLQKPSALVELSIAHPPQDGQGGGASGSSSSSSSGSSSSSSSSSGSSSSGSGDGGLGPGVGVERLLVEFTHAELYSFFGDLERIQAQLDALG